MSVLTLSHSGSASVLYLGGLFSDVGVIVGSFSVVRVVVRFVCCRWSLSSLSLPSICVFVVVVVI